jgi:hypothetical protein
MQLERSRTALRQATQAVEELRAAKDNPELFRYRFRMAMAAVQSVGSVFAAETKGHRTREFGEWWKETQCEPLFVFMREVRNAEFKRGEARQAAHHYVTLGQAVEVESSLSITVVQGGKVIQEGSAQAEPARKPLPAPPVPNRSEWFFKGGVYDGQEVLPLLDRYVAWLREDVLPTAERLTA